MAEPQPFKEWINAEAVATIGQWMASANPSFDRVGFQAAATVGLDALELKDRVRHVSTALRPFLPAAWPDALAQVLAGLPPALDGTDAVAELPVAWPLCQLVEDHGLDHPAASLAAMEALTCRWSCEFAVRPYILAHPQLAMAALHRWARHPNAHVRRLASEGSRPRLPWGMQLKPFIDDPSPTLPLLEALKDDPELYVRRSVANHLNDIAKDHPQLVVEICSRWVGGDRDWLVKHALRSLIKAGDPGALAVLGYGSPKVELLQWTVSPARVTVGDSVELVLELRSRGDQPLLIDYAVHHCRKNGSRSAKVFKWTTRAAGPGEVVELRKRHSLRQVTTRRYYAGVHAVEVLVNGASLGLAEFELRLAD